MNANFTDMTA